MTARRIALALVIGAVCGGGLVACGVSVEKQKVSDSAFVDACVARLGENAVLSAHGTAVCKCVQDKLEAQGLGDRETADTRFESQARAAGAACARAIVYGNRTISDALFVKDCAARLTSSPTLATRRFTVCRCIQDKLRAQGFGKRLITDSSFRSEARAAGAACARQVLAG